MGASVGGYVQQAALGNVRLRVDTPAHVLGKLDLNGELKAVLFEFRWDGGFLSDFFVVLEFGNDLVVDSVEGLPGFGVVNVFKGGILVPVGTIELVVDFRFASV